MKKDKDIFHKINLINDSFSSSRRNFGVNTFHRNINLNKDIWNKRNSNYIEELRDNSKTFRKEKNYSYRNSNSYKEFLFNNDKLKSFPYYKGMHFNKAPTLYYNKKYIIQLINKSKLNKKFAYDNFYNISLLRKFQLYQNMKYYSNDKLTNKKNIDNKNIFEINNKSSDNITLNTFNISCDGNIFNNSLNNSSIILYGNSSKNKSNNKDEDNAKDSKEAFPSLTKRDSNNHYHKSQKINQNMEQIGKSVMMTVLPNIQLTNRDRPYMNFNYSTFESNNEEISLANFETRKIKAQIIETLKSSSKTPHKFIDLEKKIAKIKYFQNIQINNLKNILKSDKFNIQKYIDYLIKLIHIYNNIWENYKRDLNDYIIFLIDEKNRIQKDLEKSMKQEKKIIRIIEKLLIQNVKKQRRLEHLVNIRNFLLQVKLRLGKQPPYFKSLLLRDSRKLELGNIILNSGVGTRNSDVFDFLDSFSLLNLVQFPEISPSNFTKKIIGKKMSNKRKSKIMVGYYSMPKEIKQKYISKENLLNDKNNYIPKKGEIFFDSSDKFLDIIQNLEEKNLILLNNINEMKNSSELYKQQYNTIFSKIEEEDSKLDSIIFEKIKILNGIKEKYKILESKYNSLVNFEFDENNNHTKKLVQYKTKSTFVDINFFKMVNYLNLLKEYKYNGLLLLEKLIKYIKKFLSQNYEDYDIERCYKIVGMVRFNNILNLNKKSFNEKNKFMIYDYTLKLLAIYEDICVHIKNKEMLYESDTKNKIYIQKKREEVQSMRKIINAREMRELLEEKRLKGIKKLLDKWNLPVKSTHKKVAEKYNFKFNKINKSKSTSDIGK